MRIHFIGHACFELSVESARVLVDPFLAPNNPVSPLSLEDVEPTHILLTHGHADHAADAVAVAKRTSPECVAIVELAQWLERQGVAGNIHALNLGGTIEFDWGSVKLVQAFHTNTAPDGTAVGMPTGLVIRMSGKTIYHLGDTCLFGDLRLIGERHPIDVALVPIGGHYTMDRHDAAYACKLLEAETVIPCHYDTFPQVRTDVDAFKAAVEEGSASRVVVLGPGESWSPG